MSSLDALPDAILELVLLGLDSLVCLHRAASTCKRWRRIIASDAFRGLHGAPHAVAGSYYNTGLYSRPWFEPSPSAAAVVDRRHFSLEFIPDRNYCKWLLKASHGSLLLLLCRDCMTSHEDLIVCEPLTRRYKVVPLPPLAPPGSCWGAKAVLLASDAGTSGGMSKFKVLWLVHDRDNHLRESIHAYLFGSGGGSTWRVSSINGLPWLTFIGVTAGRRYWHDGKKVFALDQSTLEFSSFVLPDDDDCWNTLTAVSDMTLTVHRDGEARIAVGNENVVEGTKKLKIFARVQGSGAGGEKWELEKTVQLSAAMPWPAAA
ncbi:unnamed protein product [Urochloa humidicola]